METLTPEQEQAREIEHLKKRTTHFNRVLIDEKWDASYVRDAKPRKLAYCAKTGTTMGTIYSDKDGFDFYAENSTSRYDSFRKETGIMLPDIFCKPSIASTADALNKILEEWEKNDEKHH